MAQAIQGSTVSDTRVARFMAQVYFIMGIGLLVTALVSTWVARDLQMLWRLNANPWIGFGLFIIQIIIVVVLSVRVMELNPGVAAILFLLYAALTGLTISSIFIVYSNQQIASVFWITAGTFFVTSIVGFVIKLDLTKAGGILFMLLCGWTLAWLFSLLLAPDSNFNWALNFLGIAFFVGLTAWDTASLKKIAQQMDTHPARGGLIVIGALDLYLDFINLFLLLLRASARNR